VCLGVLKELGNYLHTGYERIVNTANEYGVSELIFINIEDTFEGDIQTKLVYVKNNIECAEYLKQTVKANAVVLCKGSHGARTWEVVESLK
jgi:UDP-N-acetylmuramyl pentapeptide synthase